MKPFYVRYSKWIDFLFLAIIFWISRYFYFSQFGLYEDDLTRIPEAFSLSLSGIFEHLNFLLRHYYVDRPLHDGFIYVFSWLGWQIGGLWSSYLIGYLITTTNIVLFYLLLTKLHSRFLGLLGGIFYTLFAADTTQVYLTHSLGIQMSNTLLLSAIHIYLFGPKWISYVLAYPIILFAYETPFMVFMAAPLLDMSKSERSTLKSLLIHASILLAMLLSSVVMRYGRGGSIAFEMSYQETARIALVHVLQGPVMALGTYLYRPYQVLMTLNPVISIVSSICFIIFGVYLWNAKQLVNLDFRRVIDAIRVMRLSALGDQVKRLLKLAMAGFTMLILAYPMTFTTRLTAISGRTTRGHFAGVSGASLILAVFSYMIVILFAHYRREKLAIALLSGWFALLAGFGISIQQDYVKAWQYQKDFWTELLPLIQDADAGTAILVQPEGLDDVLQIGANTWNLSRVLNQLYVFPDNTTTVPRVYRLVPGWQNRIVLEDGSFQVNRETVTAPPDNYNIIQSNKLIIISTEGGTMKRVVGPLEINGTMYSLKPQTEPVLPNLQRGILYSLLVDSKP
jgi:hypothetical protein